MNMSMTNPPYFDDAATATAAVARDRQKKSTMACEMCRKRKVKCIFSDQTQATCNFCAKYSFQCIVNTDRKRRGPRPRKQLKATQSPGRHTSPAQAFEDDIKQKDRVSVASTMSDHDDTGDSQSITWDKSKDESTFKSFLGQLNSMEFELPTGVDEAREVVRHCLTMFFTHVNLQQCELLDGIAFLQDLRFGTAQPCLINAICAISARFSTHPSLITQPRYLSGGAFAEAARDQCQLDRPVFRLFTIQTFAILALYFFSISEGALAWYYLGSANRIAQIILLNIDPHSPRPAGMQEFSHRELEGSIQIAKTLYVMERLMISGTPFRPATIGETDFSFGPVEIKSESPASYAMNSPIDDIPHLADESPHMIELLNIWERISLLEREGFEKLDNAPWISSSCFQELRQMLDNWLLRLPMDLQFSSNTLDLRSREGKAAQVVFLHCLYHHCHIVLNRVFLPLLPWRQEYTGAPAFFLTERQTKCINSAASISMIVGDTFRSNSFIMPPFMGYCLFQSSIVHIHQSFCTSGDAAAEVKKFLKVNLQILITISKFYKPAETWLATIKDVWQIHTEWQTQTRPVAANHLFRRYFDRFEGTIKEPPFLVFDDLAYDQGSTPEKYMSLYTEQHHRDVGGMVIGTNLEEYQEHLRGFEMDVGKKEDIMQGIYHASERSQSSDPGELYNFTVLPTERTPTEAYVNAMEDPAFSNMDSFRAMLGSQGYPAATRIINPHDRGNIQSTSLHPPAAIVGRGLVTEDTLDFSLDEDELGLGDWNDLFESISDMSALDGVIDRSFLEFLDARQ